MDTNVEIWNCGDSEVAGKKSVALLLRRDQLLYDIRNCCYVEGHIMTDSPDEVRHTVQDVGEEGNVDRVTRVLDLAHADIVERLYPFTEREIRNDVIIDRLREKKLYAVMMNVPEGFSQTTVNLLGELVHELLVYTAVCDWLSITNPPKADVWRSKAEAALARIKDVKDSRRGRRRIRPHWL